jgi:hypothetical protein
MKSALKVARVALAAAGIGDVTITQDYPTGPIRLIVP